MFLDEALGAASIQHFHPLLLAAATLRTATPATPGKMHATERFFRKGYAAFNHRDIGTALQLLAPDVEWPNQLDGGVLHGPEEVGRYWERQWKVLDPHYEIQRVELMPDGMVRLSLLQTVRSTDGRVISHGLVWHLHELENGLVRRMTLGH